MSTVTQLAQHYNVSADTIRHYTKLGLLIPDRDPDNGYRRYRLEDESRLRFVLSAKRKFQRRLYPLLEKCDAEISGDFGVCKTNNGARFKLFSPIILSRLKQRPGSKRNEARLTVFIDFDGRLDSSENIITRRTRVAYASNRQPSKPLSIELIKGVHFDFECDSSVLHPVCHVQDDILTLQEQIDRANYTIDNLPQAKDFQNSFLCLLKSVRTPTAFMDFYSVLVMILANHCIKSGDTELMDEFDGLLEFVIREHQALDIEKSFLSRLSSLKNMQIQDLHSANYYVSQVADTTS